MATRCAQRNVVSITDFADMPLDLVRPILKRVESPQQLHEIEMRCPHLAGQTAEYWLAFIARDLPNLPKEKMIHPKNPLSWWKVYRKLVRDEREREAAQEEALRQTLLGKKVEKAEKQAVFVPQILHHKRTAGSTTRRPSEGVNALKNAKTGTQAIAAIRKQTALNSKQLSQGKPSQFKGGPDKFAASSRQIREAPKSMVREVAGLEIAPRALLPHQEEMLREKNRTNAIANIRAPGRSTTTKQAMAQQKQNAAIVRQARQVNEAKLRELTEKENAAAAAASKKVLVSSEKSSIKPVVASSASSPPQGTQVTSASPPPQTRKKRVLTGGSGLPVIKKAKQ